MYNVGESVRIKNYSLNKLPHHIVPAMREYLGKSMIIMEAIKLTDMNIYNLKNCSSIGGIHWNWRDKDFEDKNNMNIFNNKDFEL